MRTDYTFILRPKIIYCVSSISPVRTDRAI